MSEYDSIDDAFRAQLDHGREATERQLMFRAEERQAMFAHDTSAGVRVINSLREDPVGLFFGMPVDPLWTRHMLGALEAERYRRRRSRRPAVRYSSGRLVQST